MNISTYDFSNYDIWVVDEYSDEDIFAHVPLQSGNQIEIYSDTDGLIAGVLGESGTNTATV